MLGNSTSINLNFSMNIRKKLKRQTRIVISKPPLNKAVFFSPIKQRFAFVQGAIFMPKGGLKA